MNALILATASLAAVPMATASTPTTYIDIHKTTSFITTGSLETGYEFRIPASESTFSKSSNPPKAPEWATDEALTGGANRDRHEGGNYPSYRLILPPNSDSFLCNEARGVSDYKNPAGNSAAGIFDPDTLLSGYEGSYVLVARGGCAFEAKARSAQRLGAKGVIIRNTLDSRYDLKDEDAPASIAAGPDWSNTKWPVEKRDYECGTNTAAGNFGWRAVIETSELDFSPAPYDGSHNNLVLTGPALDGNLCAKKPSLDGDFSVHCPSERCLLTGRNATDDGTALEACCAWDTFLVMASDGEDDGNAVPEEKEEDIIIPALFVTMENGEELYDLMIDADANSQGGGETIQFLNVVPYKKWYPAMHYSSVLLWALTVFTLWISCYQSAKEYRNSWKKISKAVNDGVLVFQRSASNSNAGGGRRRADTEDTVDEDGDLQLANEVEMTGQDGTDEGPAAIRGGGQDDFVAESPGTDSFTIDDVDDVDIHEQAEFVDEFVGNPASPRYDDMENEISFAPTEELQQPPSTPTDTVAAALSTRSAETQQQTQPQQVNLQSNSAGASAAQNMELNAFHALFFIIMASGFLFVLFFFNLTKVVRIVYGLGGSVAMNQIIFYPLYTKICLKFLGGEKSKLQSVAFGNLPGCRGVDFKWIDILSSSTSYALGIAWIFVGFAHVQPMNNFYYWFIQDVMGVSFCILILGVIHINTIMVATTLLCLVFVYDVFYVFISPLFMGSSVMIDVATGGASGVNRGYCEKYPTDSACRGSLAPLPMLLALPWFNDYRGGFTMIGLGDIVLPGLLISFAARYDAARALVKKCTQTSSIRSGENVVDLGGEATIDPASNDRSHYLLGRIYKALFKGYFGPLVIAYSVGLMLTYIAVYTTKRGQPALLYLVPACLGTLFFLGWRRRELSELWSGPKVMRKANRMVGVAGRIPEVRAAAAQETGNTMAANSTMV